MEPFDCMMASSEARAVGGIRRISIKREKKMHATFASLINRRLTESFSPRQYIVYYDLIRLIVR